MKIAITTVGTRGDLQPYIALGIGLKRIGYEVLIVSAKNEEAFVRSFGLDFYALDVDILKIIEGGEVQEMAKGSNPIKFILGHLRSSRSLKTLMTRTQSEIWNACQDADGIIFHPGLPLGFFMAKEKNKKAILATPFPIVATKEYPSILFYSLPKLGEYYNLFTHFIFDKVFWALAKEPIRQFWMQNVKSKAEFSVSPLKQQVRNGGLILNGYSDLLFKDSMEWATNIHTTGSWIINSEPCFTPPGQLVDFIAAGDAPVYIGFGSMKETSVLAETLAVIEGALEIAGQRAVVGLGGTKIGYTAAIGANIFLVGSVPHTWLFPKMKLVVHHGGAGTTAAGLQAGKPTIIIPQNADQPAWGRRVYELGVGSKPIKRAQLTAGRLAEAIFYSLQPEIVSNAERLGRLLIGENGVQNAVQAIAKYLGE